jgi:hypothetical protein
MVTTIRSGKRVHGLQRQRVDTVADAARLHQQRAALAAEPGACEIADAFLLGGQHHGIDRIVFVGETDRRGVAGIGHIDDVLDVGLLQDAEHIVPPIHL